MQHLEQSGFYQTLTACTSDFFMVYFKYIFSLCPTTQEQICNFFVSNVFQTNREVSWTIMYIQIKKMGKELLNLSTCYAIYSNHTFHNESHFFKALG